MNWTKPWDQGHLSHYSMQGSEGTEAQEGNSTVTGGTAAFPKPTRGWPVGEEAFITGALCHGMSPS